jgi:hypothetical protein
MHCTSQSVKVFAVAAFFHSEGVLLVLLRFLAVKDV